MSEHDDRVTAVAGAGQLGLIRALVHDLRTPIATASGYLELIELDAPDLPAPLPEYLARAAIALREITSLTTTLMEVARLENGQRRAQIAELDAGRVLERIVARRRPLERAALTLQPAPAGVDRRLRGDGELIERALDALLDFALARSPRDGAVALGLTGTAERTLRFVVRDRGTPIEDARLEQLFSPRRASAEGGSSARLALVCCRLVAAAHGGAAGAARPEGGGMEFWLELPVDPPEPAAD